MNDASRIGPLRRSHRSQPDFEDTYPQWRFLIERVCCDGLCVQGRDCPRGPRLAKPPLFASSVWASRAIAVALVIACTVVAWLLVSGR